MMTPTQTALRLMSQTGTTVGHPDFVVAYLEAELAKDPQAFHTEDMKAREDLQAAFRRVGRVFINAGNQFAQMGRAITHAGETVARSVQTTTRDQFTLAR